MWSYSKIVPDILEGACEKSKHFRVTFQLDEPRGTVVVQGELLTSLAVASVCQVLRGRIHEDTRVVHTEQSCILQAHQRN